LITASLFFIREYSRGDPPNVNFIEVEKKNCTERFKSCTKGRPKKRGPSKARKQLSQRGQEGKEKPFVWNRKIYELEA